MIYQITKRVSLHDPILQEPEVQLKRQIAIEMIDHMADEDFNKIFPNILIINPENEVGKKILKSIPKTPEEDARKQLLYELEYRKEVEIFFRMIL